MPAVEHRFSDALPTELYLDTDILIAHIVRTHPHHERAMRFLDRLVRQGTTRIVVSSLSWMEFMNVVTREQFRHELPHEFQRRFHLAQWQEQRVRRTYLRFMSDALDAMLGQFDRGEVSVTPDVRVAAVGHIVVYNLRAQDAVHLACARSAGVSDIASFDKGFRRVDGLSLWNDRIHAADR